MNFRDARDLAAELASTYGTKVPRFNHTAPVAQAWVDRMAMVQRTLDDMSAVSSANTDRLAGDIAEANRYAG